MLGGSKFHLRQGFVFDKTLYGAKHRPAVRGPIEDDPGEPDQNPHLYPYPHTVVIYTGFWASSSSLMRSRRMFTSTIFSSPM